MAVSLEQIDLLRKRAHVNYEEAKEALEKCNGEIVDALVYLEKAKKIKENKISECQNKFFSKIKNIIRKGNKTRVVIKKEESNILNISVNVAALFTIFATPVALVAFILALGTKHKIRLEKNSGEDSSINKVLDKMSTTVTTIVDDVTSEENYAK
ncbi:DUF4342 domain-containing protein [Clostridium ganghwense]|uniref:DUF4342 domain-containing protein n=1 Tax=Clostridium ganghwense TaxID=312089 RepID=A0ABT4CJP5_9CLOT|nr:DUF4342 domain-containing protein [Clostridium ganghwense]MCY6369275.1 DUF4342 domain-containing protein [Clostridium ganghwense]